MHAGVPFYGAAAETSGVPSIEPRLLIHYDENDERIDAMAGFDLVRTSVMFVGAFTRSPPWPAMVIASSSFCLGALRARKADGTTRWPSVKSVTEKSPRAKILGPRRLRDAECAAERTSCDGRCRGRKKSTSRRRVDTQQPVYGASNITTSDRHGLPFFQARSNRNARSLRSPLRTAHEISLHHLAC